MMIERKDEGARPCPAVAAAGTWLRCGVCSAQGCRAQGTAGEPQESSVRGWWEPRLPAPEPTASLGRAGSLRVTGVWDPACLQGGGARGAAALLELLVASFSLQKE